ncbi:hypothetical protein CK203_059340 [Vitis vinifera]|uniref:Uncharacterized protein n=1 Tax=Vitis vinifera TaxID=29760 RepID=A0A438H2R1_VITVI|nr:hypothetical protein CK203_059340 [Vitis vinifera]
MPSYQESGYQMAPLPGKVLLHCEYISRSCACHIEYEIAEEAMNFSYVAEFSREWGEPNARDMGRMTSQPKAKGEMYILNDGMDMKAKIAAMERRLEELEKNQMQEVQAISQTPLQAMLCAICQSFEHLVEECPTIPVPPQYQQPAQAPQQALNLEQAMMNLNKVMEDFVEPQKSINAQLSQKISLPDRVESSLNKKMDGVQHDLSQKIDNIQDSISRLRREIKRFDLPTCKLEHEVESETEKEKREEIKGKKKGKSIEKDDYIDEEPQKIVIKEEIMKKQMHPFFPQALYGKIIQSKSQVRDANFVWDPGEFSMKWVCE